MDEGSVLWRNSTHHLSVGCLELQGNEIMMSVFNADKCVYALQMCVCVRVRATILRLTLCL